MNSEMIRDIEYFSTSYTRSLQKILMKAREVVDKTGISYTHFVKKVGEDRGTDLTIDFLVFGKGEIALIQSSAVHGIEGFGGSACQTMTIDEFVRKMNTNSTLILAHGVNSWGFHNYSRTNQNNVDLGRAFVDVPSELKQEDEALALIYEKTSNLHLPQKKRRNHWQELSRFTKEVCKASSLLGPKGFSKTRSYSGVVGGQYTCPEGIYFGGRPEDGIQPEVLLYKEGIEEVTKGKKIVLHLDFHTGLGRSGEYLPIIEYDISGEAYRELNKIFPNLAIAQESDLRGERAQERTWWDTTKDFYGVAHDFIGPKGNDGVIYRAHGSLDNYVMRHSQAEKTDCVTVDFGTKTTGEMLFSIIAENQVRHHGAESERVAQDVFLRHLDCFCPADYKWRVQTIRHAREFTHRIFESYGMYKEEFN